MALESGARLEPAPLAARPWLILLVLPLLLGASPYEKVVILGFDGADAGLVEQYMAEGRLPHLKTLRDGGFYAPLLPTNPPQTPVSWASFTTGLNPGRTEIFDFLRRTDGTYLPEFAMIRTGRKPLLFGANNRAVLGSIAACGLGLLVFVVLFVWRRRLGVASLAGLLAAAGGGVGGFSVAARFLPKEVPTATNPRKGQPFWAAAADAGVKARVINVPTTFPAEDHANESMLSGLGVPDMRGRIGSPSFYTSDPALTLSDNQFSVEIVHLKARRGTIETAIVGPLNQPFYDFPIDDAIRGLEGQARTEARARMEKSLQARGVPRRLDIPFRIEADDEKATIDLGGAAQTLRVGQWSGWFVAPIRVNPVVDRLAGLRGIIRFKLLSLSPELKLYASPLNFHPECQPVPFTGPPSFARALVDQFGLFKTLGWPIDTWSLPSGLTDERHFVEDMEFTAEKQFEMMKRFLEKGDDRLYVQVFDFTDRVGHMLWRLHDPGHPLYDARLAAQYADEIPKSYERMDRIVGEAIRAIRPRTALLVCSDHGFASFRRGVNYNTWLVRNGFMTLRQGTSTGGKTLEDLFDKGELGEFFRYVDWSRTKAYAMGLGNIYINLMGREPQGSVVPGRDYDEVRAAIVRQLEALVDPDTGEKPVQRVYRREDIYSGYDPRVVPDLRPANSAHYRIGWQTALGEVPPKIFEDNLKAWSGDHCSNDPRLVRGVLFSNVRLAKSEPGIADIYPTVLALLGVPPVQDIDGHSLLQ
ncbi:MAG TPA: alkaline phosphatase family protein [Candidatus Polarisedimenticolia bacterium]|nr:alkaline phosphatase family protein [Candidatus Polarisedimenticolia bacterium]